MTTTRPLHLREVLLFSRVLGTVQDDAASLEERSAQLLYYFPPSSSLETRLRSLELVQAIIDLVQLTARKGEVECIRLGKATTYAVVEVEPNTLFVAVLGSPNDHNSGGEVETASDDQIVGGGGLAQRITSLLWNPSPSSSRTNSNNSYNSGNMTDEVTDMNVDALRAILKQCYQLTLLSFGKLNDALTSPEVAASLSRMRELRLLGQAHAMGRDEQLVKLRERSSLEELRRNLRRVVPWSLERVRFDRLHCFYAMDGVEYAAVDRITYLNVQAFVEMFTERCIHGRGGIGNAGGASSGASGDGLIYPNATLILHRGFLLWSSFSPTQTRTLARFVNELLASLLIVTTTDDTNDGDGLLKLGSLLLPTTSPALVTTVAAATGGGKDSTKIRLIAPIVFVEETPGGPLTRRRMCALQKKDSILIIFLSSIAPEAQILQCLQDMQVQIGPELARLSSMVEENRIRIETHASSSTTNTRDGGKTTIAQMRYLYHNSTNLVIKASERLLGGQQQQPPGQPVRAGDMGNHLHDRTRRMLDLARGALATRRGGSFALNIGAIWISALKHEARELYVIGEGNPANALNALVEQDLELQRTRQGVFDSVVM